MIATIRRARLIRSRIRKASVVETRITINEGDTIKWTMIPAFLHTVTFLSGAPALYADSSTELDFDQTVSAVIDVVDRTLGVHEAGGPDGR